MDTLIFIIALCVIVAIMLFTSKTKAQPYIAAGVIGLAAYGGQKLYGKMSWARPHA